MWSETFCHPNPNRVPRSKADVKLNEMPQVHRVISLNKMGAHERVCWGDKHKNEGQPMMVGCIIMDHYSLPLSDNIGHLAHTRFGNSGIPGCSHSRIRDLKRESGGCTLQMPFFNSAPKQKQKQRVPPLLEGFEV